MEQPNYAVAIESLQIEPKSPNLPVGFPILANISGRINMAEDDTTAGDKTSHNLSSAMSRILTWPKRVMSHIPYWALALILIVPITLAELLDMFGRREHFYWLGDYWQLSNVLVIAGLFLVGAIKRLNWRHALLMLAFAASSLAIDYGYDKLIEGGPYPYMSLLYAAVILLPLGIGEGLLSGKKLVGTMAGIAAVAVSACLFVTAIQFMWLADWRITTTSENCLPSSFLGIRYQWPLEWNAYTAYFPLLGLIAWSMIPLALKVISSPSRRLITVGVTTAAVSISVFLFFACSLYWLADRSLSGRGPYSRWHAVALLEIKGDQYHDRILEQIERDWDERDDYLWHDWRRGAFQILAEHSTPRTAERLSALLRRHPNSFLAGESAPLLAKYKRYETVPILMRHALSDQWSISGEACTDALDSMDLPRAAIPIWLDGMALIDKGISAVARERLIQLLGEDAGTDPQAWMYLYIKKISKLPTPLSEACAAETDRVIDCFFRYGDALGNLIRNRGWYMLKRIKNDGKEEYLEAALKHAKSDVSWVSSAQLDTAEIELKPYLEETKRLFAVEPPDWNTPTTESLEKEVDDYAARVKKAVEKSQANLAETKSKGQ